MYDSYARWLTHAGGTVKLLRPRDAPRQATPFVRVTRNRFVVIMVGTLPILAVYPFLQRYFIKGVMIGALKG